MATNKPRVIKDYNKLEKDLQEQIKLLYPDGFADNLIHFFTKEGIKTTALPFETEDKYYMLRMTETEAIQIIDDDDDYDDDGFLRSEIKQDYEEKYMESEDIPDEDDEDD